MIKLISVLLFTGFATMFATPQESCVGGDCDLCCKISVTEGKFVTCNTEKAPACKNQVCIVCPAGTRAMDDCKADSFDVAAETCCAGSPNS